MALEMTDEFVAALTALQARQSVFITGKAGTGKSTLIRHFCDNTDRNVVVAAPTGVAALNINGYTLHRLFSFSPQTTYDDIVAGRVAPGRFKKVIAHLDTLIIDEVSMVRADLFDMIAASLERYGPHPGERFGGVQLVLVGDLYQLPPVVPDDIADYFSTVYSSPYFFSAQAYSSDLFTVIALTKVFRQLGDDTFTRTLNAIRDGRVDATTLSTLNARFDADFTPPDDQFWLTLTTTNRRVAAANQRALDKLPGPEYVVDATIVGTIDGFEPTADRQLRLKVGAQIMMLTNDPQGRWVNGSLGRITDITTDTDGNPWVDIRLNDGTTITVSYNVWDITRPVITAGGLSHEHIGSFTQLPFKLAWAVTIHKSQGQTLDNAIVDIRGGTWATGQLYVALSRCTSLSGLVLKRQLYAKDLKIDQRIRRFLADSQGTTTNNYAYLSLLTVGHDDSFVRPIELAVAYGDGAVFSSIVDPTRDIGNAAVRYHLSATDLQAAPTLVDVWPEVERRLDGHAIMTRDADSVRQILDTELKRHGVVANLDAIVDADRTTYPPISNESGDNAIERVTALRHAVDSAAITPDPSLAYQRGSITVSTDTSGAGNTTTDGAPLTSAWILGRDMTIETDFDAAATVATALEAKLAKQRVAPQTRTIIDRFTHDYGVVVTLNDEDALPLLADVLQPGTRVAFTGQARIGNATWSRDQMQQLATQHGFVVKKNVSRTRCDVLFAADVSTRSRKATDAARFGKPIYSYDEFLHHIGRA